jgi:hypothetical protein
VVCIVFINKTVYVENIWLCRQKPEEIINSLPFKPRSRITEAGKFDKTIQTQFHLNQYKNNVIYKLSLSLYIYSLDENNDRKSIERRLQDSLFLIVKRNREDHSWQFPQGKILEEEKSLRKV